MLPRAHGSVVFTRGETQALVTATLGTGALAERALAPVMATQDAFPYTSASCPTFGTFIEVMPGVDGLLHVSEMANYRVANVRDELKEGEGTSPTYPGAGEARHGGFIHGAPGF